MIGYLDIYIGDEKDYSSQSELYKNSEQFFQQVAPRYGLQGSKLADLDEDDKELLQSSSVSQLNLISEAFECIQVVKLPLPSDKPTWYGRF